jgi:hypothetical protein
MQGHHSSWCAVGLASSGSTAGVAAAAAAALISNGGSTAAAGCRNGRGVQQGALSGNPQAPPRDLAACGSLLGTSAVCRHRQQVYALQLLFCDSEVRPTAAQLWYVYLNPQSVGLGTANNSGKRAWKWRGSSPSSSSAAVRVQEQCSMPGSVMAIQRCCMSTALRQCCCRQGITLRSEQYANKHKQQQHTCPHRHTVSTWGEPATHGAVWQGQAASTAAAGVLVAQCGAAQATAAAGGSTSTQQYKGPAAGSLSP